MKLFSLILLIPALFATKSAPYGSWKSPITSEMITSSTISIGQIASDGEDLYWCESRPDEEGRTAIVRLRNGQKEEMLPRSYNARNLVHEYGGGSFTLSQGRLYFVNFKDQSVYCREESGEIRKLYGEQGKRYADLVFDKKRHLLYAIEEAHQNGGLPLNNLVKIEEGRAEILHQGHDFYGMLSLDAECNRLAFVTWELPSMPWEESVLWVASLSEEGELNGLDRIAGSPGESLFQPEWNAEGVLHFVSDKSGYWNLYRYSEGSAEPLCPMEADFGRPMWLFDFSNYGFLKDGRIACTYTVKARDHFGIIDPQTRELTPIDLPYTCNLFFSVSDRAFYAASASATQTRTLIAYDVESGALKEIQASQKVAIDPAYLSIPEPLNFQTEGGKTAFAFYFAPKNGDYVGEGLPPLIVNSHGGPTDHFRPALTLGTQYWTSRGFAVLNVNYGGSSGYGREYRDRLRGNWGVVDVDDCINGARHLVNKGRADPDKLVIRGGSAGGYTTLAALAFRNTFTAGCSHFGISDLEALAQDSQKFEVGYEIGLVGSEEEVELRRARSPINHLDTFSKPILLFQGGEDHIVVASQSEKMFNALVQNGTPASYLLFENEGHGFRRRENIRKTLQSELYFYGKIFGFVPADTLEPIVIHNLP